MTKKSLTWQDLIDYNEKQITVQGLTGTLHVEKQRIRVIFKHRGFSQERYVVGKPHLDEPLPSYIEIPEQGE